MEESAGGKSMWFLSRNMSWIMSIGQCIAVRKRLRQEIRKIGRRK